MRGSDWMCCELVEKGMGQIEDMVLGCRCIFTGRMFSRDLILNLLRFCPTRETTHERLNSDPAEI